MRYLLTGAEMTKADHYTSEVIGIPSLVLMERAALGVADEIEKRFPEKVRVTVLAGRGNNGADAIAAGRLLTGHRCPHSLLSFQTKSTLLWPVPAAAAGRLLRSPEHAEGSPGHT
ncbi:MAG: bifunctional ADP-dependent NAD(P)H-hydrate dehydratase/NAD(P)H-hydrate epimerase, partial [Lachnospiraceae bacterium]|nr:bifunctional ADP-dependent NAD(P)H-hydrate dehydratase/NAD(P)H-hydrate epimerase [Lachnospiraceae bacterium]